MFLPDCCLTPIAPAARELVDLAVEQYETGSAALDDIAEQFQLWLDWHEGVDRDGEPIPEWQAIRGAANAEAAALALTSAAV